MEIKQLHLRNEHMSKENLLKKEAVEHLKLAFAEEKLSCSQELAESEQKIIDLQLGYEEKIKELENNLENALLKASKYQMEAEEAKHQLKLKETVLSPSSSNHLQVVIEQQRQVILEMENALFAQRTTFSQSQEAKLARIPQVFHHSLQEKIT